VSEDCVSDDHVDWPLDAMAAFLSRSEANKLDEETGPDTKDGTAAVVVAAVGCIPWLMAVVDRDGPKRQFP
jgi:hypothetical protein